ncbi:MAG: hemolysin III family protein [Clostridiales bacterium]|jgi:hemolysin III|nr:hemolysin III family protein [Clostridiales bacterium]
MRAIKEPVSSITHTLFAVLAVPLTGVMIALSAWLHSPVKIVSFSIFGASLIMLYAASGIYHAVRASEKVELCLKKIDHSMIFVLIAGTYTPICLIALKGAWSVSILSVVWSLAAVGCIMKILWINSPRWLYTLIYLLMGWFVIVAVKPMLRNIAPGGLLCLLAGGLMYSAGAVIYVLKRPRLINQFFGFHEIFHLFVMAGTVLHVCFMFVWLL